MICDAIIHKPKRIATPVGTLGQILYAINPKSSTTSSTRAYNLFPDSSAAKGDAKQKREQAPREPAAEAASDQQVMFANLMRGVHW